MGWRVWSEDKPSGKFLVRRRHSSGRSLPSKTCSTKSLANELKKNWRRELEYKDLGLTDPRRATAPDMIQFLDELEAAGQEDYAIKMRSVLGGFLADKPTYENLTRESIIEYRTRSIAEVGTATVKGRLRHLSAWLSWCVQQGFLSVSPFVNIKIPDYEPEPKFLTDKETMQIDGAASGRIKLAWRLAYTTGLRQRNVRQMRGDQIENGFAIVPRTKKKRPILAPLDPRVLELLPRPTPPGPLFPAWCGGKEGRFALDRAFRVLRAKAGVRKGITWHMARHTFIKKGLQSGLTTFEVMGFTGHVSTKSMEPYAHFETARLKGRHQLIKFPKVV